MPAIGGPPETVEESLSPSTANIRPRYRWVILALSFMAQLSNATAAQAVAPLAPIFQPELGLSKTQVGFFSSAAFAGAWAVLLVAGSLTDRVGVRTMMTLGQIATGLLVLCMSLVGTFLQAVLVMFAAGLGRGATGPGVTKAVVDWFPPTSRATAMGVNQAAIPVAGILTASILPTLGLLVGWRYAIAAVAALVLAGGLATAFLYREVPRDSAAQKAEMGSSLKMVMRTRRLWIISAMGPLVTGVQFAVITYLALYLKEVVLVPEVPEERARIVAAGALLAVGYAGSVLARMLWGMVSDRLFHGRRMAVLALIAFLSLVISVVMSQLEAGLPLASLAAVVFLMGATAMGGQALYLAAAAETVGPKYAATAVGLCMTWMQLGFVGVTPLFGVVLDLTGSYQAAWLYLAALSAVTAMVAAAIARQES